ncbi:MAG: hypothetical protein ACI86H_001905 [bacterium]|jgi:hypothetical protein
MVAVRKEIRFFLQIDNVSQEVMSLQVIFVTGLNKMDILKEHNTLF